MAHLSIQANLKGLQTPVEPCQIATENGARRALIPIENRRHFPEVSGDVAERLDPTFYSDPQTGGMKALGMTWERGSTDYKSAEA